MHAAITWWGAEERLHRSFRQHPMDLSDFLNDLAALCMSKKPTIIEPWPQFIARRYTGWAIPVTSSIAYSHIWSIRIRKVCIRKFRCSHLISLSLHCNGNPRELFLINLTKTTAHNLMTWNHYSWRPKLGICTLEKYRLINWFTSQMYLIQASLIN
jgi:hypothetical protein